MKLKNLTRLIKQGSVEKFILAKSPQSGFLWFAYAEDKKTKALEIVKEDQDQLLAFGCIDDAAQLLAKAGFDGKIEVVWGVEKEITCN